MDVLTHIRSLVEKQSLLAEPENHPGQTTKNLNDLEMVVDDLHRENMALQLVRDFAKIRDFAHTQNED